MDVLIGRGFGRFAHLGFCRQRALPAIFQAAAARRFAFQRGAQVIDAFAQIRHGALHAVTAGDAGPGRALLAAAHGDAQIADRVLETACHIGQPGGFAALAHVLGHRIARQFGQPAAAETDAEKLRRRIRQLVRLVDDERIDRRQQFAEAFLFERHVGKQQMVIDDDQFGFLRAPPGRQHVALAVPVAVRAEAVLGGRGDTRPDRRVFGYAGQFGDVAAAGAAGPVLYACELIEFVTRREAPFGARDRQPVVAEIIGAAFQLGDLDRQIDRLAHGRQIAVKELVLKMPGAGGHERAPARQQCGDQIGEGLAGAGARFHHQCVLRFERVLHGVGHLLLLDSRRESIDLTRQRSAVGEPLRRAHGYRHRWIVDRRRLAVQRGAHGPGTGCAQHTRTGLRIVSHAPQRLATAR